MASVAVDTNMGPSDFSATGSRQYEGFARRYADAQYRPMTTPQDVLIEQARLREEQMMRQWREAQVAQARAAAAGQPTAFASGVASAASGFVSGVTGFGSMLEGAIGSAVEWAGPKPGEGLIDPAESAAKYGPAQDQLLAGLIANDPELQNRFGPSVIMPERGPERPGQRQVPVYRSNGQLQGYKYVDSAASEEKPAAHPAAAAAAAGPIGPDGLPTPLGDNMAGSSAALSGYDPENYKEGGGFNEAWNEGANYQQAVEFDRRRLAVAEEAYDKPTITEGPDGNPIYTYDATYQKYIGINEELQSTGFIPTRLPNPLGPNATQAQREAYQKKSESAFITPRYVVGQNFWDVQRMDRAGKIALQKKMRDAGLITGYIIPGVFSSDDYKALESVYAFANQTGFTADQSLKELKAITEAARARAGGGGGGGGRGGNTRSVNIQYAQTSLAQGRALLARTLSDALGRPPTSSELAEYMAMLNAAENKSPTKTVTNYVKSGATTTATSRTNPSEVDPEAMAREFAMRVNGGAEFDVNQTNRYMDMLVNRLIGAANA